MFISIIKTELCKGCKESLKSIEALFRKEDKTTAAIMPFKLHCNVQLGVVKYLIARI